MDPISFLITLAASYLLSRLSQPNGPRTTDRAAGLGDYGVAKPVLFGSAVRVAGPVIAQAEIKETVHKHKPALDFLFGIAGGLLPPVKTYTYSDTLALLLADRTNDEPIEELLKLIGAGKVLFDSTQSAVVSETLDADGRLVRRKYAKNRYCKSVTVYGGGFDQIADPILESVIGPQPGYRGSAIVVIEDLQLKDFGNGVPAPIEALVQVKTNESLASVAETICAAAGIDAARNLSTSEVSGVLVSGYAVTDESQCWDVLKPLLPAFGADAAEVGGQIRFYQRSRALRATISPDEMGAHAFGDDAPDKFSIRREPDAALPQEAALTFIDAARDYQPNTASARRSEGNANSNISANIPLVLTPDQGATAAELMLWDSWLGRRSLKFTVTDTLISIEVGRAYAIPIDGQFVPYRITRRTRGANGITEVEAQSDEAVTYTASVRGSSGALVPPNSTLIVETRLVAIDGAILNDSDDEFGFYVVMAGSDADWPQGEIQASLDGITYVSLQVSGDEAIIGDVAGTLGAGPTTGLDDTLDSVSVLTVVLLHDGMALEAATDAELDAGNNLAFVGKDGSGEYVQFKTVTEIAPLTFELTDLRRGRKGSDWAMGAHVAAEEFALLTDGGLFRLSASTADSWGVPLSLRGVTLSQDEADADVVAFTNAGEGKRPYSPVNVEGAWDGSNNLSITWDARSRMSAGGLGADDLNDYEVEILTGAGRIITATGVETATYSAADQVSDGIVPGDTIDGRARQLSDVNNGRWRNFTLVGPLASRFDSTTSTFDSDTLTWDAA